MPLLTRNTILFLRTWRAARKCTVTLLSMPWVAKPMVISFVWGLLDWSPTRVARLRLNEFLQTEVPHIYAARDVIGFPALAICSMEQVRLGACHMFGIPFGQMPDLFPYGIYTIPEVSMVGQTEETLTANGVPYEVGIAKYSEIAKSMKLGDEAGIL